MSQGRDKINKICFHDQDIAGFSLYGKTLSVFLKFVHPRGVASTLRILSINSYSHYLRGVPEDMN